jgi:hypothetical protein
MSSQSAEKQIEQVSSISVEGLEDFFVEEIDKTIDPGLSMKEAMHYYNDTAKHIRSRIKTGDIPAIRIQEGDRRKWRIYPSGVPNTMASVVNIKKEKDISLAQVSNDEILVQVIESKSIETGLSLELETNDLDLVVHMKNRIAELERKLEAELYRNGYLEAQIDVLEGKYKFIGLLEVKESWWQKLLKFYGIGSK